MRYLAIVIALGVLGGCAPVGEKLATLRHQAPTGEDYKHYLAAEYLSYGESLAERGHPIRADHFAAKGLATLADEVVPPEESAALAPQHQSLLLVLTDDVKDIAPDKAAHAQLLFDCMVDESDKDRANAALCRESFETALAELQFIADTLVHGSNNQFVVYFSPTSITLSDEAATVLDIVVSRTQGLGEYKIELMAYGKKPSAPSKIKILATKRLLAIEKALIAKGINAGYIHSHAIAQNSEVFLSVDETGGNENAIGISIQTFGQADGAKAP